MSRVLGATSDFSTTGLAFAAGLTVACLAVLAIRIKKYTGRRAAAQAPRPTHIPTIVRALPPEAGYATMLVEKPPVVPVTNAWSKESQSGEARAMAGNEQERALYEQHRRINELTIAKLETEVALLQSQLKASADTDDRIQAAREFHELTIEKTKLEIDSLRLHIVELRKRIDEFGLGHD